MGAGGRTEVADHRLSLGVVEQEVRPGGCRPTGRLGKRCRVKRRSKGGLDRNGGVEGRLGGTVG